MNGPYLNGGLPKRGEACNGFGLRLGVYVRDKSGLPIEEVQEIEKHLLECDICNARVLEIGLGEMSGEFTGPGS